MRYRVVSTKLIGFKPGDVLPVDVGIEPLLRAGLVEPVPEDEPKPSKPKGGK